jgi:hypothetical protein
MAGAPRRPRAYGGAAGARGSKPGPRPIECPREPPQKAPYAFLALLPTGCSSAVHPSMGGPISKRPALCPPLGMRVHPANPQLFCGGRNPLRALSPTPSGIPYRRCHCQPSVANALRPKPEPEQGPQRGRALSWLEGGPAPGGCPFLVTPGSVAPASASVACLAPSAYFLPRLLGDAMSWPAMSWQPTWRSSPPGLHQSPRGRFHVALQRASHPVV